MERGFKAQANRTAVKVRAALGLAPHDPLDPFAVCEHFEIDVIRLSSLKDELGDFADHFIDVEREAFSAVTVPCGLRRAIVHNDAHYPVRQRSNIAHELAHGFLGHASRAAFTCNGERNYESGVEAEAAFLSGCLLITNEAAWHIVRNDLIAAARRTYKVSQAMLDYRLKVSGALKRVKYLRRA